MKLPEELPFELLGEQGHLLREARRLGVEGVDRHSDQQQLKARIAVAQRQKLVDAVKHRGLPGAEEAHLWTEKELRASLGIFADM